MDTIINAIQNNYQWIFSGAGVLVIGFLLKKHISSRNNVKQQNIIAGGDVVGRDKGK